MNQSHINQVEETIKANERAEVLIELMKVEVAITEGDISYLPNRIAELEAEHKKYTELQTEPPIVKKV